LVEHQVIARALPHQVVDSGVPGVVVRMEHVKRLAPSFAIAPSLSFRARVASPNPG
jgi:hypothetical protein